MKKLILAIAITFSATANAGFSDLMSTVEAAMPVLDRIAAASEEDINLHCVGNVECIEGTKRDIESFKVALNLLKEQQVTYNANKSQVIKMENLLNGNQ